MRTPSPSVIVAGLVRFAVRWPFALHMSVNRQVIVFANWLEDGRALDRPMPWLIGLMLVALLIWLVRDARA